MSRDSQMNARDGYVERLIEDGSAIALSRAARHSAAGRSVSPR
jgi:hypothetical protein